MFDLGCIQNTYDDVRVTSNGFNNIYKTVFMADAATKHLKVYICIYLHICLTLTHKSWRTWLFIQIMDMCIVAWIE